MALPAFAVARCVRGCVFAGALVGLCGGRAHAVPGGAPDVVYLHFADGSEAVLAAAVDDPVTGRSSIGASTRYPAFVWPSIATGVETRREVVGRIARKVNALFAPYNVLVTLQRPAAAPYTMVMVGGGPRDLGITDNLAGVAYMDCGNQQASNLVFAFPANLRGSEHGLVMTIAQEAAHAFGLEHTANRRDVMLPEVAPEQVGFLDEEGAVLGDRLCGNAVQNSHAKLVAMVGAWTGGPKPFDDGTGVDRVAPVLRVLAPAAGARVAQPFTLELEASDDVGLDQLTVAAEGQVPLQVQVLRRPPYATSLRGFAPGPLTLTVTALDRAGNQSTLTLPLEVGADPGLPGGCATGGPSRHHSQERTGALTLTVILGWLARRRRLLYNLPLPKSRAGQRPLY